MKPINFKTIGYICLKTGKFFKTHAELLIFKANQEAKRFVINLLKSSILEDKIKKAKDKLTSPFKRFVAKVKAFRAYKVWFSSLSKSEKVDFI